jgi:hypothetical protein
VSIFFFNGVSSGNIFITRYRSRSQCCGSETIFFRIRIRIPFSSEFWIRIRMLFD